MAETDTVRTSIAASYHNRPSRFTSQSIVDQRGIVCLYRARLLLLPYSTIYAHSSIKGSKKTQKAYPQLIATEIQKEIQSWPPTSQLPSFGFSSWPFSAQTRSQSMLSPIISHPDPSNPIWSRVISRLIGRAYEANKKLCSILAYDDVVKLFELISLRLFPPDHLCPSKSVGVVHRLGLTRRVH